MNKKLFNIFTVFVVVLLAWALTSCGKVSKVTGVTYDNETGVVSWDSSVTVATYNIAVNGVKHVVEDAKTQYKLAEAELTAEDGSVDIDIEGVDEKGKVVAETETEIVLLPDMNIEFVDGYFDWSNSTNELESYKEEGYTVKYKAVVNGKELSNLLTESKYKIPTGNVEFRVKAVLVGTTLFFSNYTTATSNVLETPSNINYDAGKITWKDIDFLGLDVNYKVVVGEVEKTTHANYINLSEFYTSLDNVASFSATVQAISNDESIISSDVSEVFTYQYLGGVQNIHIKNGILSWDVLEGATKYQLEIDGNTVPDFITTNQYNVGGNTSHAYRVRGWSDASLTVAKWSNRITINTLATPTPYFSGNSAIWSTVNNASSYLLKLVQVDNSGNVVKTILDGEAWDSNMFDFESYCEETGIYKFSVCAVPLSNNYSESSYSNELEIVRLGLPTRMRITETSPQKPNGEITITLAGIYEGAKYTCSLNGVTYGATNDNSFTILKPLESYKASVGTGYSEVTLTIQALALTNTAVNNKLYLDCLENLQIKLRQLNAPSNLQFIHEGTEDYVTWDSLQVDGQEVSYGVLFGNASYTTDTNRYNIPNLASGNYTVSIYAKGDILKDYNTINWDSSTSTQAPNYYKDVNLEEDKVIYLTSTYSTKLNIKKLQTPTNIALNTNDGILTWDYVYDARGYMIYISYGNGIKELYMAPGADSNGIIPVNYAEIDPTLISEEANQAGFVVEVYAVGNTRENLTKVDTFIIDSDASSLNNRAVFHILKTPELKFDGENLVWNAVAYAEGYTINNVKRSDSDGNPYVNWSYATTSATSFAWDDSHDIEAGHYRLCLDAEGDFSNYFNSAYSNVLEFTKLKTPVLEYFLDVDDTAYFVELEEGATEYLVKIALGTSLQTVRISVDEARKNGEIVKINEKEYLKITPNFDNNSDPTISIQALGDNANYMASNKYTLTQKTRELEAPVEPVITASFDEKTSTLHITADITNPFGKGYTFYFNGTEGQVVEKPEINYTVGDFADLEIQVGYEANVFTEEDGTYIFYYKSQASATQATIYLLANVTITRAPSNSKGVFTLRFNKVTNGQYRYSYDVKDASGKTVYTSDLVDVGTVDQFKVDLAKYANATETYTVTFHIYSVGNDNGTIVSNPDAEDYSIEL